MDLLEQDSINVFSGLWVNSISTGGDILLFIRQDRDVKLLEASEIEFETFFVKYDQMLAGCFFTFDVMIKNESCYNNIQQ